MTPETSALILGDCRTIFCIKTAPMGAPARAIRPLPLCRAILLPWRV